MGDGLVECCGCSCLCGAELLFELAPCFFDRIEVGRVGRQIEHGCPASLDAFPYAGDLVRTEVVHDHDLAWQKLRAEHVIEIGKEDFRVGGGLDGHGGDHAAQAHRTQDGEDLPVAFGRRFDNAPASKRTSVALGHLGGNAALVQINQPFWSDLPNLLYEYLAALPVRFGVALGGVERLFLSRKPSSPTIFHKCGVLT